MVLRTFGADQVVEAGREVPLPLLVGVLIDQRGLLGSIPCPAVAQVDDSHQGGLGSSS
ncbi:hypothetical protein [Streptomyces sp. AGS-58]|uniref:hypothetical protein n=1 Tax=unclassified Streptomyces TaxID=2593676 RepID=UPI0035A2E539